MKIKAHVRNLGKLFMNRKYIIPGYQRPYEWEKEQLEVVFENIKSSLYPEEERCPEEPCLFGTVQLNKIREGEFEIIDGHQRLTTFSLFLRVLGELSGEEADPGFYPENQIDQCFEVALKTANSEDTEFPDSVYHRNYLCLKSLIEKYIQKSDQKKLHELIEFLKDSICFVEVVTDFSDNGTDDRSVERTLKIFETLNTTGLPLDMKDLFKIKYYDKIKTPDSDIKNVFAKINEAYATVCAFNDEDSMYNIGENDLISSFKFWIIGNMEEQEISANRMKMSANEFFLEQFKKKEALPETASLESFLLIAQTINETQHKMLELDKEKTNLQRMCAKELLYWSGYWHLKNLFFVFVHAQKKGDLTQAVKTEHVEKALELTEYVWKVCSMFHAVVGQILKDVFKEIGVYILKEVVSSGTINMEKISKSIKSRLIDNSSRLNDNAFLNIIQGDIFSNTRKDFFLAISYIEDAEKEQETAREVKRKMFYYTKWQWDVEHILSKGLYDNDIKLNTYINGIGNLLYLEKSVNRKLGANTGKYNNQETAGESQESARESDASNKAKEYQKSALLSVKHFCSTYKEMLEHRSAKGLIDAVKERTSEKQKMLMNCYANILQET